MFLVVLLSITGNILEEQDPVISSQGQCLCSVAMFLWTVLFTDRVCCRVGCIKFLLVCASTQLAKCAGILLHSRSGTMCLSCCRTKVQFPACHVLLDITVLVSTPAGN